MLLHSKIGAGCQIAQPLAEVFKQRNPVFGIVDDVCELATDPLGLLVVISRHIHDPDVGQKVYLRGRGRAQ